MKENELDPVERKLQSRLLLSRRVEADRLMLADHVLQAALDGSRPLTGAERAALMASPLTLRRMRVLAEARRVPAANDAAWQGSAGLLRAAASAEALDTLRTDDGYWSLHFLPAGAGWQIVLKLAADAPFAARLLREHAPLRVVDGGGAILLQGRLDADGECEAAWAFASPPARHLQQWGARFAVEPM